MIRRARRDGKEGRRERIEKGSHCFFKSSGYDKLEFKHKNLVFFKLIECIIKKKGVKQYAKICAIGEQNVVFKVWVMRSYIKEVVTTAFVYGTGL